MGPENPLLVPVLKASEADSCLPCQVSLRLVRTGEQTLKGHEGTLRLAGSPFSPQHRVSGGAQALVDLGSIPAGVPVRPSGGWCEVIPSTVQHIPEWCLASIGLLMPSSLSPLLCSPDSEWRCYLFLALKPFPSPVLVPPWMIKGKQPWPVLHSDSFLG